MIYKYIQNLQNLYQLSSEGQSNKIEEIEFYLYLITKISNHFIPLIGKVYTSKLNNSDFSIPLYTPKKLNNNKLLKKLWEKDYEKIANFFMKNNKLDFIFNNDFLVPLLDMNNYEISEIIYNELQKIK